MLDRLGDLVGDRHQELDLFLRELSRLKRADVQCAGQPLPREDRHGENRLVLILREVGEELEAGVEVRLRRDHHRCLLRCRRPGDALAAAHPRTPGHLLDTRPVRRPQHELVAALVVQVDEAGLRVERVRHLAGHQRKHLLEIQRRVHRRDGLGEKT